MTASVARAKFASVTPLGIVGKERRANPKICHMRKVASAAKQEFEGNWPGRERLRRQDSETEPGLAGPITAEFFYLTLLGPRFETGATTASGASASSIQAAVSSLTLSKRWP